MYTVLSICFCNFCGSSIFVSGDYKTDIDALIAHELAHRAWARSVETVVMAAPLDTLPLPDGDTLMEEAPSEAWLTVREEGSTASPARMVEKRDTPSLLLVPGAWISAAAEGRVAEVFGVPDGAALLVMERTTWSLDQPITLLRLTHAPGHRVQMMV